MKKPALLVAAVLALVIVGTKLRPTSDRDGVFSVPNDDPVMEAAIADAKRTLPDLLAAMAEGVDSYSVKVPVTDAHGTEHFWLSSVEYEDGVFFGTIDNDPDMVQSVKLGQRYSVKATEISDWLYVRDGKVAGNRTLKALFSRMRPDRVAGAKRLMGWD